jgi:hypothetical protein
MTNLVRYIVGVILGIIIFSMFIYPPSWYMLAILVLLVVRVVKDLK